MPSRCPPPQRAIPTPGVGPLCYPLKTRFGRLLHQLLARSIVAYRNDDLVRSGTVVGHAGQQEVTTVEAANFLNVSRPFVIKEIASGRLPHRKVGSHRRIALEDLLAYAQKMRAQQASALDRLADNARELGLDY